MAMRLSMTSTSLQTFEMDVNVSNVSKSEVLKFLSVIIQNLLKSGDDPKYRQLRLSNAKIQRMTAHAAVMSYFQQVVGFETIQENGESLLRIVRAVPSESSLESALKEVTCARERIESRIPKTVSNSSSANSLPEILTAKQKTRKMMEEKAVLEKLAVKNARKRTVAQIKADKHVRENDPNWKPATSAAASKSGEAMTTFRDKFGEE